MAQDFSNMDYLYHTQIHKKTIMLNIVEYVWWNPCLSFWVTNVFCVLFWRGIKIVDIKVVSVTLQLPKCANVVRSLVIVLAHPG